MKFDTKNIICVSRCDYRDELHVQNHCHNFFHLFYVTGGCGNLAIDGIENYVHENDIYMIPPWTHHEIIADPENPLRTIEVKFVSDDESLTNGLNKVPSRFNNENIKVKMMFINLVEEAITKRPFYKEMVTANCMEILLHFIRMHNQSSQQNEPGNVTDFLIRENKFGHDLVNQILHQIHKSFTGKVSLRDLAKTFHIDQAHLCRLFSRQYGISPIQYVNNLRLQKAKELLLNTDLSITEISRQVGFNSIHYMSRYFTSKEKLSPVEYRLKSKNNVNIFIEEKYKIVNYKI